MGIEIFLEVRIGAHPDDLAKNEWVLLAASYIHGLVQLIVGFVGPVEWVLASGQLLESSGWFRKQYPDFFKNRFSELFDIPWNPISLNYPLYSIMANVANHLNLEPISNPRGLPGDLSNNLRALGSSYCASWIYLNELDANTNTRYWNKSITTEFRSCAQHRTIPDHFNTYRDAFYSNSLEDWVSRLRKFQSQHRIPDPSARLLFWFN